MLPKNNRLLVLNKDMGINNFRIATTLLLENHSTMTSNFYPFSKNTKFFGNN